MGKDRRFKESRDAPLKQAVPHAYESNITSKANLTGGFDKAIRF